MKVQSIIKALLLNTVLFIAINAAAQNVGINTTAPLRSFHINSGSLLITGDTGTVPNLATGAKFFWSPAKSAFRAGTTSGKEWDYDSLGMYSFAYGRGTKANGGFSMAGGNYSIASKQSSFSFGNQVQVSGDYSAGFGSLNSVTGTHSFTVGGDNDADGNYSVAFGRGSTANSYGSLVIGRWNKIENGASNTGWVSTDPAFVIGNGSDNSSRGRANAFSVAKNGNMKVEGTANIAGSTTLNGFTTINANTLHNGTTLMNGFTTMFGGLANYGTTQLYDHTTIRDSVLIVNNKPFEVAKTGGTAPIINLVPIGVVNFKTTYVRGVLDDCKGYYNNLAGNFIISINNDCTSGIGPTDASATAKLYFNPSQVAPYKEIIAVPSVTYQGIGTTGNVELVSTMSIVLKDGTGKPESYKVGFFASEMPLFGIFGVEGTVMFYGIR